MVHRYLAPHPDLARTRLLDLETTIVEAQRVTERDELVRALRRHDPGDDRGVEHRALLRTMTARAQSPRNGPRQADAGFRHGAPRRDFLGAHVHHGGALISVEMRESGARHQPPM